MININNFKGSRFSNVIASDVDSQLGIDKSITMVTLVTYACDGVIRYVVRDGEVVEIKSTLTDAVDLYNNLEKYFGTNR